MTLPYQARDFPLGFLWGAATSICQVEDDNRWNDWREYEQSVRLPHQLGDACQHYQSYDATNAEWHLNLYEVRESRAAKVNKTEGRKHARRDFF